VFLTTHNLAEAERLCGAWRSSNGEAPCGRHPDELKARSATRAEISGRGFGDATLALLRRRPGVVRADLQNGRIVLELAGSAEAARSWSLIVQNVCQVEEVRKDKGSLEDVFLTLMEEGVMSDVLTVAWKEWRELLSSWAGACAAGASARDPARSLRRLSGRSRRAPSGCSRPLPCSTGPGCR